LDWKAINHSELIEQLAAIGTIDKIYLYHHHFRLSGGTGIDIVFEIGYISDETEIKS
jgi:glyoxylase-like metal-dependent hydrolase (beta-lactamase superfamily II)